MPDPAPVPIQVPVPVPVPAGLLHLAAALALAAGAQAGGGTAPTEPPLPYSGSDIVHPIKVDERGSFLSYDLSHRALHRRSPSPRSKPLTFYELRYRGEPLRFNLSLNTRLLAPGFLSERRFGGIAGAKIRSHTHNSCHMIGEVQSRVLLGGLAALSTCDGLKGVFQLMNEDYFIEPVSPSSQEDGAAQPHRIYKRQAPQHGAEGARRPPAPQQTCGVQETQESLERSEKRRERWEQKQHRKRRIKQRSISKEKWVETLVVADTKMVEYHGSENIEKYVLTVMNMVAGLFHHASIGNPINIAIVRLILLENEEEDLKISHHADNTLRSFCKWQKSINIKGDSHPLHHDVAVLLTRKDICAAMNRPCETLGLSHVAGMCQPHRSCNINEDTGLPLAFTVAHELGHSFGIQHDGSSNDCEPVGKRPFIMSPQLLYDTSPLTWSRCSREYITRFLDRGWGLCLDDPPAREVLDYPLVPPGVLYDVSHQCRLQYGPYSTFCDDMDSVCSTLWCSVGSTCHSKLDAAVDGTACGENKWCFNGECVPVGFRPEPIGGGWSSWSPWASCSRSCGAGVQSAERQCSSPTPKYGGRYCLGERKRFRICNIRACPPDKPSFRQLQCSQFNPMLYKGKLYKWTPVPNNINPCELHCRPEDEFFAEKLRDAVIDGTPCDEGSTSRDICINGICKSVGCDYEIGSSAVEDRCGVCHGDGSTCHTIQKTFEDSEGLGYVDIGIIPVGAREIRIEEVAEAGNFLALRSEDPEKYFLNGGWTIQWNGDYRVAGTTFTYKRTGNWENLTSPGPTVEPVWIQLLFQETNPGVRYQYTIQRPPDGQNRVQQDRFRWHLGSWTSCTATCGTGVQRQLVHCVEKLMGIVEEQLCDALTRPEDQQRTCSEEPCPARWWVGEWQGCSATCGWSGLMKRTVLCIQSVGMDEQRALHPADCQHLPKPDATMPCHQEVPCPSQWAVGNWSECSTTCGNGTRRRWVSCSGAACDPAARPSPEAACSLPGCQESSDSEGSGSGSSVLNEIHHVPSNPIARFNPLVPSVPELHDVNTIPEEDFSARKGNVFVDDFYYDYNFINFHEDLSYYPFTEKETKSEEPEPELSSNDVEGPREMPTGVLHTTTPGGASGDHLVTGKAEISVNGEGEMEPGDLAMNNLLSVAPGDTGTATPEYAIEDFVGEEEDALLVPHSKDPLPTQSITGHDSANSPPLAEPQGAVTRRTSPGQDAPAHGLTPRAPHPLSAPPTLPAGGDRVGTDTSGGLGELGSLGGLWNTGSQEHSVAGSVETDPEDPEERGLGSTGGAGGATPTSQEQEGCAGTLEGTSGTPAAPVASEQGRGAEQADLPFPTPQGLGWEVGWSSGSTHPTASTHPTPSPHPASSHPTPSTHPTASPHPAASPHPTGAGGGPTGQAELLTPLSLTSAPLVATTAFPQAVSFSPGFLGLPPQLSSSSPPQTDALSPAVPPTPAHSPPTHPGGASPSGSPPLWWGLGVSQHPASPHAQQSSPGATPGTSDAGGGGHELPQPSPVPSPLWREEEEVEEEEGEEEEDEEEEALLSPPATAVPRWEVGGWSECSATCGVGAIWRSVRCSSGSDQDCAMATKPVPARRCSLRPCSSWQVGSWSKCSRSCGRGVKVRDVHCMDTREQRLLRPFHCQAALYKPPRQLPCQERPCLGWYTSSWRECSEPCGGGEQERLVTCPELGHCEESLRPNSTRPCNTHPCTSWVVGSWGECSAPCGGGIQRRQVKCINTQTGQEGPSSLCDHQPWPQSTQKCNLQDCDSSESGSSCERDRLTFAFCQTLRLLGRCHLPTVHLQCCRSCLQHGHRSQPGGDRGDERDSRR